MHNIRNKKNRKGCDRLPDYILIYTRKGKHKRSTKKVELLIKNTYRTEIKNIKYRFSRILNVAFCRYKTKNIFLPMSVIDFENI